ncbi:MAG TPA: zf-HC2 domain-containing protein [Candidatus Omnitrophota bacterium]|nr:zf-HC2 domain-containing protein [Candidatus Omnitrophota bacterium]
MENSCPSEETMGEFVSGCLPENERFFVEAHLFKCEKCRILAGEARQVLSAPDFSGIRRKAFDSAKKNFFPALAALFFGLSFICPRHFLQFLIASLVFALRWISLSVGSKTLIMMNEKAKDNKSHPARNLFQRTDIRK